MDIEILNDNRLHFWCAKIDIPGEAVDELVCVAAVVRSNPALMDIFIRLYEKNVLRHEWQREWTALVFDPQVQAALADRTVLFYLLVYLAALPLVEQEYQHLGISMEIFHETMLDITVWLRHTYELEGRWNFTHFPWVWRHLNCELFRLGRLQFMLIPFEGGVTAFRRKIDGEILLLADPNQPLRDDGCALHAGIPEPDDKFPHPLLPEDEKSWQAVFTTRPNGWCGNPISPYGIAQKKEVFLSAHEWDLILQHGDTVLDMHIPHSGTFNVETCRESLRQAYDFFPRFFPDRPFKAGFCHTWFFTPQLQQILPAESHILHFQREFYLYPHPGGPGFLWSFAFGDRYTDLTSAPRDTSLRRGVLEWLDSKKPMFELPGVMFHHPDTWGSQPYMKAWDQNH